MAKYIYSTPKFSMMELVIDGLKKKPEWERDCLPEALRKPVRNWIVSFLKNDATVCIDPDNGNITIDQLRMYTFKCKYSKKEMESRRGIVKQFAADAPEQVKKFADEILKGLDFEDDKAFRSAMEDIVVIYDAYSMMDPWKYPPYGTLFRHGYTMTITPAGIRKSIDAENDPSLQNYFCDKQFMDGHISRVKEQYDELMKHSEKTEAKAQEDRAVTKYYNPDLFNAFSQFDEVVAR